MAWNSTNWHASNWFKGNWYLGPSAPLPPTGIGNRQFIKRLGLQLGLQYRPLQR